jgi:CheY-like chemotaxis protein
MASVLLIEDDDAQRFVAAFALKKAGHEVREAADGLAGVAAARELRPDVIVCDVMMPGMTGYEVLAQLRAEPVLATVPVILLTAMSDRKHMRQGMTAGADDYLTKPYRSDELCEAINAVPYGARLMAVFAGDQASVSTSAEVRVLRAAIAP